MKQVASDMPFEKLQQAVEELSFSAVFSFAKSDFALDGLIFLLENRVGTRFA